MEHIEKGKLTEVIQEEHGFILYKYAKLSNGNVLIVLPAVFRKDPMDDVLIISEKDFEEFSKTIK